MDDRLNKRPDENKEQYIWRVCQLKDSGLVNIDWPGLGEIFNCNLQEDECSYFSESAYRKPYQYAKLYWDNVFSKMVSDGTKEEEYKELSRALEEEKVKYRDERNAYSALIRENARSQENMKIIERAIRESEPFSFCVREPEPGANAVADGVSSTDLVAMLSDLHIGATYESQFGCYNSDIAQKRLENYADEVINFYHLYKAENLYVPLLGDLISGRIHPRIAITNREDTIQQITLCSKLIAAFIKAVSPFFKKVYVAGVGGNHSRLGEKASDCLPNERLDNLIPIIVDGFLAKENVRNVKFIEKQIDPTIGYINVRGKDFCLVHGDLDSFSKKGSANIINMLGFFPYAILSGHLHFCATDFGSSRVKKIQGGSLGGSGDDYTVDNRLYGKPSQMLLACDDKGIRGVHPIEFA